MSYWKSRSIFVVDKIFSFDFVQSKQNMQYLKFLLNNAKDIFFFFLVTVKCESSKLS